MKRIPVSSIPTTQITIKSQIIRPVQHLTTMRKKRDATIATTAAAISTILPWLRSKIHAFITFEYSDCQISSLLIDVVGTQK
jgi:hypothetical protein